jgi:hypothetical protein
MITSEPLLRSHVLIPSLTAFKVQPAHSYILFRAAAQWQPSMSRLTPRSESLLLSFRLLRAQLEPDICVQWNTFFTCVQLQHCFFVIASETRTTLTLSALHWTSSPEVSSWPSCIVHVYGLFRSVLLQSFVDIDT